MTMMTTTTTTTTTMMMMMRRRKTKTKKKKSTSTWNNMYLLKNSCYFPVLNKNLAQLTVLPDAIGKLKSLQTLDLHNNQLQVSFFFCVCDGAKF